MITLPLSYYSGGDRGTQTLDLSNANAALYQLSYIPMLAWLPSFRFHFSTQQANSKLPLRLPSVKFLERPYRH